jgi:iron(III) transport system permease protein
VPPLPKPKLVRNFRQILTWRNFALFCLASVVLYLTLVPLVMILYGTFTDGPPGTHAAFTLRNYIRAYGSAELFESGLNSVLFSGGAAAISFVVGCYLAWVTERTNTPLKPLIYGLVLFPFLVPGVLTTISWVFLLSPNIGLINRLFTRGLGFAEAPFDVYTLWGMIWAFGIDHITLPFLLMAAAFRAMDPTLEEAALVSGMGRFRSFYQVNLKLMLPTILATGLLLFIRGLETFEAPAVIGIPARIRVFATDIFLALRDLPTDYNLAGTFATAYLGVTVIGLLIYLRATRVAERFATITGRGYRPRIMDLGRWRYLTMALAWSVLFVAVVLPIGMIVWTSFLPFYTLPSMKVLSMLTLNNYRWIFALDVFYRALANNLISGVAAATLAVLFAAGIAWIVIRTEIPGRKCLDIVAFTPIAFPGIVMGLALLWVYLTLPIPIYGTLWILIIGYVTKYIPLSLRVIHAALLQVHRELEEAAEISSPSWIRNFVFILLPLIIPSLLVGWLYVLTLTLKVLSLPILLSHVGTEVLPVVIYSLFESGEYPQLCAMGVILIIGIAVIAGVSRVLSLRFGVQAGEE